MSSMFRTLGWWAAAGVGATALTTALARRRNAYSFRNRIVVITGGSRGLGLVMARQLAEEGALLAICAREIEEVEEAARELMQRGARVYYAACDVSERSDLARFFAGVRRELGPIDVLINNAGIIQVGPQACMTRQDYEEALKVHFWGPWQAINQVLPEMQRRRAGRIVNIASIGGKLAVPHLLPYCSSKFALVGLSEGLRVELAREGIVVTTVCPGLMRTGSPRNALFKGQHQAEYAWFSIGGSLPLVSMNAERAARQIINACRYGRAELILSLPARLAVAVQGLAPGLVSGVETLVNATLPAPGGIGPEQRLGRESTSRWSPSWITVLNEKAASRNNE